MSISEPTDEELRELYFLFRQNKPSDPRMPIIPEITITDQQVTELISLLAPKYPLHPLRMKELIDPGRYFPDSLYRQKFPSHSEIQLRFEKIQRAALALLDALGVTSASTTKLPPEVTSYLQIAAADYGEHVGRPEGINRKDLHWEFWPACKLPSVITSISLLEHWAGMARDRQESEVNRRKAEPKRTHSGDSAFRVLIHRLALVWLNTHGTAPGAGFSSSHGRAQGPFIEFAAAYLGAMQKHITPEHRRYLPTIDKELARNKDSIRTQLLHFKRRLSKTKDATS